MISIESVLLKVKNRKLVVVLVPIVAGLFAGGILVIRPALSGLGTMKTEVASLKQKEGTYSFILENEKKLAALKSRFMGDRTWLIEQLNGIAESSHFSILTILPEETRRVGDYLERSSVRLDAEASYHQLGEFISRVENLGAYVKILGMELNAETSTQAAGQYAISMSVGVFTPAQGAL